MPPLLTVTLSPAALAEPAASRESQRHWRSHGLAAALGWCVLFAACLGVGLVITGPMQQSALLHWDRRLPVDVEQSRTQVGETWSAYGSVLGETVTVVAVAMIVGAVLLLVRHWASVLTLATAMVCEVTVFVATTIAVPRSRPDVEQLDASPPTSSFPSGHTAAATALAVSLALIAGWHVKSALLRGTVWVLAVLVGPVVGVSRIYRGMHHPLDVAMGLLLGVGCVAVALLGVRAWVGRSTTSVGRKLPDGRSASPGSERRSDDTLLDDRLAG